MYNVEAILGELQSKSGVIGSFVTDENGMTVAYSFIEPEKLGIELKQKLNKFLNLGYKNNPFEYVIFESENGKILIYNLSKKLLVILASPRANPLVIHSTVKKNIRKPFSKPAEKPTEHKKTQTETKKPETTIETTKPTKTPEEKVTHVEKPTEHKKTQTETKKPETTIETTKPTKTPEETKEAKKNEAAKQRKAKPGLEEIARATLMTDTSGFPTQLDLILHLRVVYGADRFLATRILDFKGKKLREISQELKISVEVIMDIIEKDPAVFGIKFHR